MSAGAESGLSARDASAVVRYWLASLQLEEALASRPRARRVTHDVTPRLDAPSLGQDYFKLALDADFANLVSGGAHATKPLDSELAAFFETWLYAQYRRGADDKDMLHMVAFPVVHLPRGELAGLLRYGLRLRFGDPGGPEFAVPTRAQRRRREFPAAPGEARLSPVENNARQWPFFVDTRLLNQQLGVARESIDAFFDTLREQPQIGERQMLALVCHMLESELAQDASASASKPAAPKLATRKDIPAPELLTRIVAAMTQLLGRSGGRARVYPVGIVLDATRAKTTWYLQREMQALLDEPSDEAWDRSSCLGAYVMGAQQAQGRAVQRALFPGPALSASQRDAAEVFWGSRLSAVQGPPGTGKTTLILHLAAQALVHQIDQLARTGAMGDGLFVVTSTNNRAVDNVVDPLAELSDGGLPLALRAGSRLVCDQVLAPQLLRARDWLTRAAAQPAPVLRMEFDAALAHFKALAAELDHKLAPRVDALALESKRNALRLELSQLRARDPSAVTGHATRASAGLAAGDGARADAGAQQASVAASGELAPPLTEESVAALLDALDADGTAALRAALPKAHDKVKRLCELCEAAPSIPSLQAVDRHHRRSQKKALATLDDAFAKAGLELDLGLPPDLPPTTDAERLMASWETAADAALTTLDLLAQGLARMQESGQRKRLAHTLEQQLAALERGAEAANAPAPECDPLQRALFQAAVAVRSAWAATLAAELVPIVESAAHGARSDGSLRAIFNDDGRGWQRFRQLFGTWGCTLLSLGNCLPAAPGSVAQLVIDEAGQCHPAYAFSGLLRARNALVIGDVHQLEPVIDLEPDDDERVLQASRVSLPDALLAPYRIHSQARCSVQRLADRAVVQRAALTDHFRCQPEIIAISDALCGYGLRVHTPPAGPAVPLPFLPHPVSLVDIDGAQEQLGGSWFNPAELSATLELTRALLQAGIAPGDIAVITPYRGQLEQLRRQFAAHAIPVDASVELHDLEDPGGRGSAGVGLGTVHRFQGGERSIVLFSSVVTQRASLPFLDRHPNLLNVAVSRARHRLVALGRRDVLASGKRTRLLVQAAQPLVRESFQLQLGLGL